MAKKKNNNLWITLAVVVIIVLVIVGLVMYNNYSEKLNETNKKLEDQKCIQRCEVAWNQQHGSCENVKQGLKNAGLENDISKETLSCLDSYSKSSGGCYCSCNCHYNYPFEIN